MSEQIDRAAVVKGLNAALPLQARDALAASVAAGTLPGVEGIALREPLREIAAAETAALEKLAARVLTLGGEVAIAPGEVRLPATWRDAANELLTMHRETLDVLVDAIPAGADDAEGEATEHLLEHVIAAKRDAMELLERVLR